MKNQPNSEVFIHLCCLLLRVFEIFTSPHPLLANGNCTQKDIKISILTRSEMLLVNSIISWSWSNTGCKLRSGATLPMLVVLFYGSDWWRRPMKNKIKKINAFHDGCNIYWPNKISDEELCRRTNRINMSSLVITMVWLYPENI